MEALHLEKEELFLYLIKILKENKRQKFQNLLEELQPYDIAELYTSLPKIHHHKFILMSTPEQITLLLQELDSENLVEILQKLGVQKSIENFGFDGK